MSDVQATQPVADDTKAPAQPDAAVDGAQTTDELASFFKEYEEKNAQPQPKSETKPAQPTEVPPWAVEIIAEHQQLKAAAVRTDVDNVIKSVKGELDIPLYAVRGWIDQKADEDPRIKQMFEQRNVNPEPFKRLLGQMQKQFRKEAAAVAKGSIDPNATEDRAAVTAAMRGASTKAPDDKAPDVGRMTDQEFAAYKRKLGL